MARRRHPAFTRRLLRFRRAPWMDLAVRPRALARRIALGAAVVSGFGARFDIVLREVRYQHRLRMTGEFFSQPDHLLAKGRVRNLQIGQHQAQAFLVRCTSYSPQGERSLFTIMGFAIASLHRNANEATRCATVCKNYASK